jgi:hypothetical protein
MGLPVHPLFRANTDCNLNSVDTGIPNTGVHNVILCIEQFFFSFFVSWGGVQESTLLLRPLLLCKPRIMMDDECGAVGGMIGMGNRST